MDDREYADAIPAGEADAQAAAWLERQDRDGWNEADRLSLDAWLAASLAHRVAYWRLKAAWGRTERLSVLRSPRLSESSGRARLWTLLGRSAAVIGIAAIVMVAFRWQSAPSAWTYATPLGGHETVRLGDGSQIELNTDTSVRVAFDGNGRKVWLDEGEAYFQIRHDAQHPFTVVTRDLRIVDLGTKFVVRKTGSHLKISLVEGSARLEPNGDGARPIVLKPGDVAIATAGSISVSKTPARMLNAQMSWRRDVLVFDHTTLAAAADEFNRYNREKLIVADPVAASRTIGGTFPKNGLVDFAEVARAMLGLKVTKDDDRIVISN
jgi:transmembrane sensor